MRSKLVMHGFDNSAEYYNYHGYFVRRLHTYYDLLSKVNKLNNTSTDNSYIVRDCLQNYNKYGFNEGFKMLKNELLEVQTKLFEWLDSKKNPFFYIYYKAYEMNTYNGVYGCYGEDVTGINNNSHVLSSNYIHYKLN